MAINENKRLTPVILKADQNAYVSLSDFRDYQPANPACSRQNLAQILEEMRPAPSLAVSRSLDRYSTFRSIVIGQPSVTTKSQRDIHVATAMPAT